MDNQHTKISGYRDLTQPEIDLMNEVKEAERSIANMTHRIKEGVPARSDADRQCSIARTEFESAFMRLVRAVAKPVSPWAE